MDTLSPTLITASAAAPLALPSSTTATATAFNAAFARLPQTVRSNVLFLRPLMLEIAKARKKRPAMAAIAARYRRPGLSAETLKRLFYEFEKIGMAALVDHKQCKGCQLPGCTWAKTVTLDPETIRVWLRDAITNDKRGLTESWKGWIRKLVNGEQVPGAGTWRDVFTQAYPWLDQPARCPWSLHKAPPGWALSSFMQHKPAKVIYDLGHKGSFAAWSELPEVRIDLSTLRPFEWIVVDDHRLDFKVFVDVPGRGVQLVELWGLFVMDVATRSCIAFALKPRVAREDGSDMAFEHRDMQHLIAHVLGTYGIPKGFTQKWIIENAAAAVSTEAENLISYITRGRVEMKRTGIQVGDHALSGYLERWGNYRGKRWLEAWFGPLDIVLGGVKGQMGSDYWSKPGSFDAREAFGHRLTKLLEKCTPEVRAQLQLPFEWAGQAHWLISAAVDMLNHRQMHDLEGFEEVRFFRYDVTSAAFPLCPRLAQLHGAEKHLQTFLSVPENVQEMWLNNARPRRQSPAEKMALNMPEMECLSKDAVLDLMFDEVATMKRNGVKVPLEYRGGNVIDIEARQGRKIEKLRFRGHIPGLELGQKVIARLNADRPNCGLWLLDEARRYLGWLEFTEAPTHEDIDGLHRELGSKIAALNAAKKGLNRILHGPTEARQKIGDLERLTGAINTASAPVETEIPALPESSDFVRHVYATTGATPLSDAEKLAARRERSAAAATAAKVQA